MDLKSTIHPGALDLMLNSAVNASQKGQSQYSTPIELGAAVAEELPNFRPTIVDLTCGAGLLLSGCANKTTEHVLGLDVDPRPVHRSLMATGRLRRIQADLTLMYEPMRQIDFRSDCFALNPPWSLNWHIKRLEALANSAVPAVAKTLKSCRGGSDTIDSTLATLMIALDRLSGVGEGFLIGYTTTLERLIFAPGAVGELLTQHIWKQVAVSSLGFNLSDSPFAAATVIYFSAAHDSGPTADGKRPIFLPRVSNYSCRDDTVDQWIALEERARAIQSDARPEFHLTLRHNQIRVRLGLFDTALARVNRVLAKTAKRLNDLNGRNPMQVVMQRDERNFILGLLRPGAEWTVDPVLRDAVQAAVRQYNATRAPLVPLPKIQRLGYLDESDDILCVKDLPGGEPIFRAGERYKLSTRSVRFTRAATKLNLHGEEEELELSGQELAITISNLKSGSSESVEPFTFMDGSLRGPSVKIGDKAGAEVVQFTLQELVAHFEIPEVPDIASADPARFNFYLEQLRQLERLTHEL